MPPSEFKENAESLNTAESVQVDVNPSLTKTELDAFASLLEVEIPGTWARSERNALIAAYITAARRLFAEVESRGRAIEALSARLTAKNAELDKVIREAATNKAKLAAVEKAVRDSYPWECDSPTHNRICHLRALTPVNIALGGSEMPRPPAEEAQDGPKPFGTGSGRGTGVAEAPGPAQESEWPDVDGWSVRLIGGEVVVRHEADERQLSGWDIPLGAVLAFIEEQQPEEDDEEQADLSLIPADLIKSDPGIRGGEPCITGTRIPVSEVASYLADGLSWDEVREMVPSLPVPSTEEGQ